MTVGKVIGSHRDAGWVMDVACEPKCEREHGLAHFKAISSRVTDSGDAAWKQIREIPASLRNDMEADSGSRDW